MKQGAKMPEPKDPSNRSLTGFFFSKEEIALLKQVEREKGQKQAGRLARQLKEAHDRERKAKQRNIREKKKRRRKKFKGKPHRPR